MRVARLGLSRWLTAFSLRDLERLFGVDHRVILLWWIEPGLLPARRRRGRCPHEGWRVETADVEAFIRGCGWAHDWRRMDRRHPLGRLAEIVNRADPWLGRADLAAYLGMDENTLGRWVARGLVRHRRRFGAGGRGELRIRARDFPAIAEAVDAARAAARDLRQVARLTHVAPTRETRRAA